MNRFFNWLSSRNPLYYVLIYIALVFVFGGFYRFLTPAGFLAPYARYEPAVIEDYDNFQNSLSQDIIKNYVKLGKGTSISADSGKYTYDVNSIKFLINKIEDPAFVNTTMIIEACCFDIQGKTEKLTDYIEISFNFHLSEINGTKNPDFSWREIPLLSATPVESTLPAWLVPGSTRIADLGNALFSNHVLIDQKIVRPGNRLIISTEEFERLDHFSNGVLGHANYLSGHLWHMIYFSVIVITTLGLGDILPLSSLARLLVGLEAISGITLIGLFLNALAHRGGIWANNSE